jgi:transposase InsO family protein
VQRIQNPNAPDPAPNWVQDIIQTAAEQLDNPETETKPPIIWTAEENQINTNTSNSNIIPSSHLHERISQKTARHIIRRAYHNLKFPNKPITIHINSRANRSVTNDITLLTNYKDIKKYPISGVAGDAPAIYCTGKGVLPWRNDSGDIMLVQCYYCTDAADTIISPDDIVVSHIDQYYAWGKFCNVDTSQGYIEFHQRDGTPPVQYHLYRKNGLWYHDGNTESTSETYATTPHIKRLTAQAQYELYHQWLGHTGECTMTQIHHHILNIPPLKGNLFYKCASCLDGKAKQREHSTPPQQAQTPTPRTQGTEAPMEPGQNFAMDFAFVRGSTYIRRDKQGTTITSLDGFRSYLSLEDRKTRYQWVFPTKQKTPPLDIIDTFLQRHGNKNAARKTIRLDQGGDLYESHKLKEIAMKHNYNLEPTGAGAPFQNGMVERINQTLGNMMRCLLHLANIGPEYWSFALTHTVYLKNRLPHAATGETPHLS